MNESEWTVLYHSSDVYKVELLKILLENNSVAAVIINKNDSAYRVLGEAYLYVPKEMKSKATEIINNKISNLEDDDFSFSLN